MEGRGLGGIARIPGVALGPAIIEDGGLGLVKLLSANICVRIAAGMDVREDARQRVDDLMRVCIEMS